MLKKTLCLTLCLLLTIFALPGCEMFGGGGSSAAVSASGVSADLSGTSSTQTESTAFRIGFVQYAEHTALDTVREAFMSRLEEYGYDEEQVEIDYQNAGGDKEKAQEICEKFVSDEVDMIVALATPAAQAAVQAAGDTKVTVLFSAVTNPREDLNLQDLSSPDGNVTGVSNGSSSSATLELIFQTDPELKTLGLLYSPDETASVVAAQQVKEICGPKGVTVVETTVSKPDEVQKAMTDLCAKTEAVFSPADNTVAAAASVAGQAAREAKKPWYVGADSMVSAGALGGVSADYTEIGNKTADQAVELIEGRLVQEVPVYVFEPTQIYLNQTALDSLSITLPDEVLSTASFLVETVAAVGTSSEKK